MKIYTGNGDKGTSNLFSGRSLPKNDKLFEALGNVDELNSFLGLLIAKLKEVENITFLENIQHLLFIVGSKLAVDGSEIHLGKISNTTIKNLENEIDRMEGFLEPLTKFILPGGSESVALAHVCRTICRRSERSIIGIAGLDEVDFIFFNRLSDYFFVLSRFLLKLEGKGEVVWDKNVIK